MLIAAAVLALLLAAGLVFLQHVSAARRILLCEHNLFQVQLALERYALDQRDSTYPAALSELLADGYLTRLPGDPFSPGAGASAAPGSPPLPGQLIYYPVHHSAEPAPEGYVLLALGPPCREATPIVAEDPGAGQSIELCGSTECDYALLYSGLDRREDWYERLWQANCRGRLLPGAVSIARRQLERSGALRPLVAEAKAETGAARR